MQRRQFFFSHSKLSRTKRRGEGNGDHILSESDKQSDSFSHEEVSLDTGLIQQLVKDWTETETTEEETADKLEPRRRNKPAWTRDFTMTK